MVIISVEYFKVNPVYRFKKKKEGVDKQVWTKESIPTKIISVVRIILKFLIAIMFCKKLKLQHKQHLTKLISLYFFIRIYIRYKKNIPLKFSDFFN